MVSTEGEDMKNFLVIVLLFCGSQMFSKGTSAPHVSQPGFTIVGLRARTNNEAETGPSGKIGPLWNQLLSKHLADSIPDRVDDKIVAVLTDYASDEKGDYTYMLGVRVRNADHVPEGMAACSVPAANYAVVISDDGPPSRVVPDAWKRIWSMSAQELGGRRAFRTDFEEYDEAALSRPSLRARIYLSLR